MRVHTGSLVALLLLTLSGCATARHDPPSKRLQEALAANPDFPVACGATIDPTRFRAPGDSFSVVVVVRIARGWHIYPVDHASGPEIPTSLQGDPPNAARWSGAWRVERTSSGPVYEDSVRFIRPLQLEADARGVIEVPLKLTYEACDALKCRPPVTVPLIASVRVISR